MPPKCKSAPTFSWPLYTVANPLSGCDEVVVVDKSGEPIKFTRYSTSLSAIVLPSTARAPASKSVFDPRVNGEIPVLRYQAYRTSVVDALRKGRPVKTREQALATHAQQRGQARGAQDEEGEEIDQLGSSVRDGSPELAVGLSTTATHAGDEQPENEEEEAEDKEEDDGDGPAPATRFSRKRHLIPASLPNEQPLTVYDNSGNIVTEYFYSPDMKNIVLPRHVRGRVKRLEVADGTMRKVVKWKTYKRKVKAKLAAGQHVLTCQEALRKLCKRQTSRLEGRRSEATLT
ncbi:hypothetical protein JCM10295v2_006570 [Rhodotorula toruloides]